MKKTYSIFADYYQFYLWDGEIKPDAPTDYTESDVANRIKAASNIVVIQPMRNMDVSVELEIVDGEPDLDFEVWDHIVEASLGLPSGKLEIHECTGGSVDQIILKSGTYRVRAYFGGLRELSEDGLDGNDCYKLIVWPAPYSSLLVLKQFDQHEGV